MRNQAQAGISASKLVVMVVLMLKKGESATKEDILEFLDGRVARWWLPDDVVFIDEVPKTSVSKFSKKDLRAQFSNYELPANDH